MFLCNYLSRDGCQGLREAMKALGQMHEGVLFLDIFRYVSKIYSDI